MLNIVEHKGEGKELVGLMEELQDYLVRIDPMRLRRRLPEYGELYIRNLLAKIKKNQGKIYVAESDKVFVGMVAGIIEKYTRSDEIEYIPHKTGRVLELVVSSDKRGQKIGTQLMKKMEEYFLTNKCSMVSVKVFEPNKSAYNFYHKLGYQDRFVDLLKKIS